MAAAALLLAAAAAICEMLMRTKGMSDSYCILLRMKSGLATWL